MMKILMAICITIATLGLKSALAASYIWWEGENPQSTNFPDTTYFSQQAIRATRHLLSAGDWLTVDGKPDNKEIFARYQVTVTVGGEFHFWTRKFWKHGPFRWRFGNQNWRKVGRHISLADNVSLAEHVSANWVYLGKVKLDEGNHDFELRLLSSEGEKQVAGFDCFLLTDTVFLPNGKFKPDEKSGLAEPGFFPYEPSLDPFQNDALLDLRYLNEEIAGQHGFVRRSDDQLLLGSGEPVRFWGVNVSANNAGQDRASVDYLARRLAKFGVNMVRYHSALFTDSADPSMLDSKKIDDLFYLIAALKKQGIYTKLSFYFPLWFQAKPELGFQGYKNNSNKNPFALLFFDPHMQRLYKAWAAQLLNTKNPYTGTMLAQETALAILEIVNEDSYFFWTFSHKNIPRPQWQKLEIIYGQWLSQRYGSLRQAFARWGRARLPADSINHGRAGLYEAWHMTGAGIKAANPHKRRRISDQVRFLTEHQRAFYASMMAYFKQELGYGGLVSASNWHVSDPAILDALERYSYSVSDVIDRHGYFGGEHTGTGSEYSVQVGHRFKNRAAVQSPDELPIRVHQLRDFPHIISELGWPNPNFRRADAPLLTAAYSALQGIDGVYFFTTTNNFLRDTWLEKFSISSPVLMGNFPGMALAYRRAYIRQPAAVIEQIIRLEDLYELKGSATLTHQNLDALRQTDLPDESYIRGAITQIDPLSFYVGPVVRRFGADPGRSTRRDLSRYIDRDKRVISSLTGELRWHYDQGLLQVNTPRFQAAAGFLHQAGEIMLEDISITCNNEFASIAVVSLDEKPIAQSRTVLIQAMTEERPYRFKTHGNTIKSLGSAPFGVRRIEARIILKTANPDQIAVTALDLNGYPSDKTLKTASHTTTQQLIIHLAPDVLYYIIER